VPGAGALVYSALKRIGPLRAIVRRTNDVLERYRLTVWRLEGHERDSGVPLTIVFAGQLESKNYVADLAFASPPAQVVVGRQWVWKALPRRAEDSSPPVDLRIVELDPFQRRLLGTRFAFHVPCWIGGVIDLQGAAEHIRRSKNAKEDLRRMRRDEVSYEIANSEAAFERFYSEMYEPYITAIYGDRAFSMSHRELMGARDHGELLLVKMRGEAVAGLVILYEEGGPRAWSLGVKDGNREYVKAGALRALDYLLVSYLADKGHATVHMGASRPFLKDGVLRHKRRIGMRLTDHAGTGFALRPTAESGGAGAFLVSNPFIFERDNAYTAAVFFGPGTEPRQEVSKLLTEYGMPGLQGLALFTVPDIGSVEFVPVGPTDSGAPRQAAGDTVFDPGTRATRQAGMETGRLRQHPGAGADGLDSAGQTAHS
jgi:hypothetical protein